MLSNFLLFSILFSSFIFTTHSYNNKCLRPQEILLLQLKDELIFDSSVSTKLVQWNESDECCSWDGVECDASGYVVSLQLDDEAISGGIGESSSLFKFKYLRKLSLASNHMSYYTNRIPKGIGNLTYLTHLDLSYASFCGQIPSQILSLKRLAYLDISGIPKTLVLENPNLEMLVGNLTGLRELYLEGVNITSSEERRKWSHIISSYIPNLTSLGLSHCNLLGPLAKSFTQLHSLSFLQLSFNDLSAVAVPDLFNFPNLTYLILMRCNLNGSVPSTFANLTKLIYIDLFGNSLTGSLSSTSFEGLSNLTDLNLGSNSFSGDIPHSLYALPSLLLLYLGDNQSTSTFQLDSLQSLANNLTNLDLSNNNLSVDVGSGNSSSYGHLPLKQLYLASCNLTEFPNLIKHMDLEELILSNNRIASEIPSWIGGTQLESLDLSSNLVTGLQKPYHIPASLGILDLGSNQLKGELELSIPPESTLWSLSLNNNSLSGSIPTFLSNVTNIEHLDLSDNKLSGTIPSGLLENVGVFVLERNNISGSIPDIVSMECRLTYLELSNNNLEGKIPKSLERCESLAFMNVGYNNIDDTFPCMLSPTLSVLGLRSNRFHGEVSCHRSWWSRLRILDVSSNNFGGSLESMNFSSWRGMMMQNVSDSYAASVPITMKGIDLELLNARGDIAIIDFSQNNFHGKIPDAVGDLNILFHLNLSHNALNGSIPKSFGQLKVLESLDLSVNQLTGRIPTELGELTFIGVLNLSYNKLVGMIPNGRQIQTFPVESFEGNPGLCGFPLNISCSRTDDNDNGLSPRGHEEKKEIEWEYVSAALGYVVGVGIIVWLLLFCR